MPRGFLVKRTKHSAGAFSYRVRHNSEEDRLSESGGSDQEYVHTNFGSPDSGYSPSPVTFNIREKDLLDKNHGETTPPRSSPLTVSTGAYTNYPSPFYYFAFDRLCVSGGSPASPSPVKSESGSSTPNSPNKRRGNSDGDSTKVKVMRKPKAARKINFDEDKSSPVSGTIIKDYSDSEDEGKVTVCGDIDSSFNFVEITPEAKAELDKIENKIGDYICQLCKEFYNDAFQLAQHRCSRIVHVEYRCPECDKVFNCPANLASHRRWHKPRPPGGAKSTPPSKILPSSNMTDGTNPSEIKLLDHSKKTNAETTDINRLSPNENLIISPTEDDQFACNICGKKFRRQAYLKKHVLNHANDEAFSCQICGKLFPNEIARSKHESHHHGSGTKDLSCLVCGACFPNKIAMEKHARSHSNETFTCKYCSNTFYSSPGLTRHINKCHPSENRQVILLQLPVNRPC